MIPEDGGGFSAELLEFPGCFADGETANEAFENLERTALAWMEAMLSDGQEIPPPSANYGYSGKFLLRLPRSLHRYAARKAERDEVSLNQCLVTAIAAWVGADDLYTRYVQKLSGGLTLIFQVSTSETAMHALEASWSPKRLPQFKMTATSGQQLASGVEDFSPLGAWSKTTAAADTEVQDG